jgi:hypothetical protein
MSDAADSPTTDSRDGLAPQGLAGAIEIQRDSAVELSELKSTAKAASDSAQQSANAASQARDAATTAQRESQTKLEEINSVATQCLAAKTKVEDWQAVVATKSDHIQKAQEHADTVRANLDRALTSATQHVTDSEALKLKTQSALDVANQSLTEVRTIKSSVDTESAEIETAKEEAQQSSAALKTLAEKASSTEERITAYEKRLTEMDLQHQEKLKSITELLPGATSAGLAHAFHARAQTFHKPQKFWQWIFIGSVLINVVIAAVGLWHFMHTGVAPSYDELWRLLLTRFPVAGFLIWLAIHAGREAALAKRLEEDYGYKAAVASSFLGFNQQMLQISAEANKDTPLAKLCTDTLNTIATPPGRIYEKHPLSFSLTDEIRKISRAVTDLAKLNRS